MTGVSIAHTKYTISLFGIELSDEESAGLAKVVEDYARSLHPRAKYSGAAVWNAGEKLTPLKGFHPTLIQEALHD